MTIGDDLEILIQAEKQVIPESGSLAAGWQRLSVDLNADLPALDVSSAPIHLVSAGMAAKVSALVVTSGVVVATAVVALPRVSVVPGVPSARVAESSVAATGSAPFAREVPGVVSEVPEVPSARVAESSVAATGSALSAREVPGVVSEVPEVPSARVVEPPVAVTGSAPFAREVPGVVSEVPGISGSPVTATRAPVPLANATRAPSSVAPDAGAGLDEELLLLSRAKHQMDAGRSDLAQSWLTQHRIRFPRGMLAVERDGLTVLLACQSKNQSTRELGRRFVRVHPTSPLVDRIVRACETDNAIYK